MVFCSGRSTLSRVALISERTSRHTHSSTVLISFVYELFTVIGAAHVSRFSPWAQMFIVVAKWNPSVIDAPPPPSSCLFPAKHISDMIESDIVLSRTCRIIVSRCGSTRLQGNCTEVAAVCLSIESDLSSLTSHSYIDVPFCTLLEVLAFLCPFPVTVFHLRFLHRGLHFLCLGVHSVFNTLLDRSCVSLKLSIAFRDFLALKSC